MALRDFLRRIGIGRDRGRRRGVRGQPAGARSADARTVPIGVAPRTGSARPAVPGATYVERPPATVAAPRPAPAATVVGRPSVPAPARTGLARDAATEYTDARSLLRNRVVAVLVAVDGELEGEVYRVYDGESRLGRSPECEIPLPSKKISREHAKLIHSDGVFAIAPLSDRNPTLVNDEPTQGAELGDGDRLRLGNTTFRFRTV